MDKPGESFFPYAAFASDQHGGVNVGRTCRQNCYVSHDGTVRAETGVGVAQRRC
jgi:hypothetical protein